MCAGILGIAWKKKQTSNCCGQWQTIKLSYHKHLPRHLHSGGQCTSSTFFGMSRCMIKVMRHWKSLETNNNKSTLTFLIVSLIRLISLSCHAFENGNILFRRTLIRFFRRNGNIFNWHWNWCIACDAVTYSCGTKEFYDWNQKRWAAWFKPCNS